MMSKFSDRHMYVPLDFPGSIAVQELNTKDAYVHTVSKGGISVKSLSGTAVLQTAGHQSAAIDMHLSGTVGVVIASTSGAPISCCLPQHQGEYQSLSSLFLFLVLSAKKSDFAR
jgi:hypothetical protein